MRVHVPELIESQTEVVSVDVKPDVSDSHYTSIKIAGLYNPLRGRTLGRVKDQLGSMYREDLRSQED